MWGVSENDDDFQINLEHERENIKRSDFQP